VEFNSEDEELIRQLNGVHFYFRNGKIYVESKEDLKKPDRLGRSPDRADTLINGLYVLPLVIPVEDKMKKKALDPSYSSSPPGIAGVSPASSLPCPFGPAIYH